MTHTLLGIIGLNITPQDTEIEMGVYTYILLINTIKRNPKYV